MKASEHESSQAVAPIKKRSAAHSRVQALVLIVATTLGIYGCYQLALPFLSPIAWALALAVLFTPLQRRLESKLKFPSLAATISVLVVGLLVAVPATFVGQQLIQEAAKGAEIIKAKAESGEWRRAIEAQPRLAPLADWVEQRIDLPGTLKSLAAWLTTTAGSIVKGSLVHLIGFCLTFYLLFFFLRDRSSALQSMRSLSPLRATEMDCLFNRVADTIFATVYGTLAIAVVQGLLVGLMFWCLGLPTPLLWGMVMALLAVVPVAGSFFVWVPAAVFLALEGSWGKALALTVWGVLVVGVIDNLLRPVLVGSRLKLHTALAFLSVIGGLILFGPSGLILGPVALTITTELLKIWRVRAVNTSAAQAHSQTELGGTDLSCLKGPVSTTSHLR